MSLNYALPNCPNDPISTSATVSDLHGDCLAGHIVLRLIHIWLSDDYVGTENSQFMYTLWLDKEESLVEGVTDKIDIPNIMPLFNVGTLYVLQRVPITAARRTQRNAPGNWRIYLRTGQICRKIDELQSRKQFPVEGFRNTEFEELYGMTLDPTHLADLTGRVLSISKPIYNNDGTVFMMVQIENTRNETAIINYTARTDDFYYWAEVAELTYPVVVTFTSILVAEPEPNHQLLLTSTKGTRIIHGSYSYRFRTIMNRFFHHHRPITILQDSPVPIFKSLRKPLPNTTTFGAMIQLLAAQSVDLERRYWCLAKINGVPADRQLIKYEAGSIWYDAFVCCDDMIRTEMIKFEHDAMVQLLRLPVEDFHALELPEKEAILRGVEGKCFTLELRIVEAFRVTKHIAVTTIWNPLCLNIN